MKKGILTVFLSVSFLYTGFAQDDAFTADTKELMKITSVSAFADVISQMGAMVSSDKKEAFTEEANLTLDGIIDKFSVVYMEEFTHDEIKDLLAFYATPTGKKMAEKTMVLAQKGMAIGQAWGIELQGVASKYVE